MRIELIARAAPLARAPPAVEFRDARGSRRRGGNDRSPNRRDNGPRRERRRNGRGRGGRGAGSEKRAAEEGGKRPMKTEDDLDNEMDSYMNAKVLSVFLFVKRLFHS